MIQIFMTEDGAIHQKDEIQSGAWIALTNPTATEILEISETCGIDPDHSGGIYGRKSEGFPYVYENPVHPSDSL